MKINSIFKKGVMILALATVSISCNDDETKPTDNTITGIAASSRDFDILVEALKEVNLAETLQGPGPFTVFAPTDEAFAKFLRKTPYRTVKDVPKNILKQILLNHVVSGSFQSTALTTGYIKTLATNTTSGSNTMSMYVDLTNAATTGVMLNGFSKVETADIIATNGVIHVVDKVIDLPTIVTHATANKNFTSLVGALTGAGQPDFVGILSGTGPFTVFAPTNTAFTSLNSELVGGIAGVSASNLTKVLQYHVVNGSVLSGDLTNGLLPTLLKQNFTVTLSGGPKIIDVNKRTSTIIAADVQCSNGVIHVLDKVLLPKL